MGKGAEEKSPALRRSALLKAASSALRSSSVSFHQAPGWKKPGLRLHALPAIDMSSGGHAGCALPVVVCLLAIRFRRITALPVPVQASCSRCGRVGEDRRRSDGAARHRAALWSGAASARRYRRNISGAHKIFRHRLVANALQHSSHTPPSGHALFSLKYAGMLCLFGECRLMGYLGTPCHVIVASVVFALIGNVACLPVALCNS